MCSTVQFALAVVSLEGKFVFNYAFYRLADYVVGHFFFVYMCQNGLSREFLEAVGTNPEGNFPCHCVQDKQCAHNFLVAFSHSESTKRSAIVVDPGKVKGKKDLREVNFPRLSTGFKVGKLGKAIFLSVDQAAKLIVSSSLLVLSISTNPRYSVCSLSKAAFSFIGDVLLPPSPRWPGPPNPRRPGQTAAKCSKMFPSSPISAAQTSLRITFPTVHVILWKWILRRSWTRTWRLRFGIILFPSRGSSTSRLRVFLLPM